MDVKPPYIPRFILDAMHTSITKKSPHRKNMLWLTFPLIINKNLIQKEIFQGCKSSQMYLQFMLYLPPFRQYLSYICNVVRSHASSLPVLAF